ncbi:hypothetical protein AOQ84DRAFT_341394 [Glonium stellatum]|uniref:Alpha/beta hydrolase fold-3 domain-containing protein n=1 Tax=Glonium stellatum TaxID=574774 RepID=A0A8E2EZQ8_9PEZI|nr:hypothetical protein AOQ84DRAFT_341394 [Glonium stellatum]
MSALSGSSRSTIVRINYRISQKHAFPTPVHDVLTGYDWVLGNLIHKPASTSRYSRIGHITACLGVCGELVGGGLATMLALTECKTGSKRLLAAAVNNPILDWVFPFELSTAEDATLEDEDMFQSSNDMLNWWNQLETKEASPRMKATPAVESSWKKHADSPILPTKVLLHARDAFFRRPEDYFDRFASPICFFRSPSAEIIYPAEVDKLASLPSSSDDSDSATQRNLYSDTDTISTHNPSHHHQSPLNPANLPTLIKRRTYHRVHPPTNSGLLLPHMYITTGRESPLLDQASELARQMKRSVMRQARTIYHAEDSGKILQLGEQEADRKVCVSVDAGAGLWSRAAGEEWRPRIEDVGVWLRGRMRQRVP